MELLNTALIYLALSALLVPLFQKMGLGSVLGYLAAGAAMGPYALSAIQDVAGLSHFAELGVVLLLFIIGLELQPQKLWGMRSKILGLGFLQILLCTAAIGTIVLFCGFNWIQSLIIGFALSLSSTAFAMQTLIERKELATSYGQSSFAILLTQDIVAIPALALIPLLGSTAIDSNLSQWTLLWFFVTLIVLFLSNRFVLRPLFRLTASLKNREILTRYLKAITTLSLQDMVALDKSAEEF